MSSWKRLQPDVGGGDDESLELETDHRPIGHASGRVTPRFHAPALILTTEDAMAPPITVAVSTASAQRQCGRSQRQHDGRRKNNSEECSKKFFHNHLRFSRHSVEWRVFVAPASPGPKNQNRGRAMRRPIEREAWPEQTRSRAAFGDQARFTSKASKSASSRNRKAHRQASTPRSVQGSFRATACLNPGRFRHALRSAL